MSPDEREMLAKSLSLAEENNKILRSMKRSQKISSIMTYIYWFLIIGSAVGAFYFLQPYWDQVKVLYSNASTVLRNFKQ